MVGLQPHEHTVHLCAANALLLLPEDLVQLDDLAWAHPARGGYAFAGLEPGCPLRERASGFACLE